MREQKKFVTIKWAMGDGIIEQNKVLVIAPSQTNPLLWARKFAYDAIGDFVSGEFPTVVQHDFDELDFSMFAWAIFDSLDSKKPSKISWNWND